MRYLLDSDVVTDLYDKSATNHPKIATRLAALHNIDLIIAATALATGCTLVSGDALYREFQASHPDLALENWV